MLITNLVLVFYFFRFCYLREAFIIILGKTPIGMSMLTLDHNSFIV